MFLWQGLRMRCRIESQAVVINMLACWCCIDGLMTCARSLRGEPSCLLIWAARLQKPLQLISDFYTAQKRLSQKAFCRVITAAVADDPHALERLEAVLKPIMWRNDKASVGDELDLKPRTLEVLDILAEYTVQYFY